MLKYWNSISLLCVCLCVVFELRIKAILVGFIYNRTTHMHGIHINAGTVLSVILFVCIVLHVIWVEKSTTQQKTMSFVFVASGPI